MIIKSDLKDQSRILRIYKDRELDGTEQWCLENREYGSSHNHPDGTYGEEPIHIRIEYGNEKLARALKVAEQSIEQLQIIADELSLTLQYSIPPEVKLVLDLRLNEVKKVLEEYYE